MKTNRLLALIFLYTISLSINAQSIGYKSYLDSLVTKITNDKIAYEKLSSQIKTSNHINLLKSIGSNYYQINNYDSAIYYYNIGAQQAIESDNLELYSSLKYNLSLIYLNRGLYSEALDAAMIALETDRDLGKSNAIISSINSVGMIYQEMANYDQALDYRLQSIKLSEEANNTLELANGYFNLGSLYVKIGKHDKALSYFTQAESTFRTLLKKDQNNSQLKKNLSESIYSRGIIYVHQQLYKKAISQFNEALKIKTNILDDVGIGNCYYQMGLIHYLENNFNAALQSYLSCLQYKISINDQKGKALVYFRIGELYYYAERFNESETFAKKSIKGAMLIGDQEILKENYQLLYRLYSDKKDYKTALNYHELYKLYTDSCMDQSMSNTVEELSIRYESEKKEKENKILIGENKVKALTIQRQKSKVYYLSAMIILVLVIVVVLVRLNRSKRKSNLLISHKNAMLGKQNVHIVEQKKVIETKNKRMTDSISYAKRIQHAMLGDVAELNAILDDAFVFFQPKDIVSGDFYWFRQVNNKLVLAAIDCTGHGVPGAFMSMLGNSFLNQIVLQKKITSPDKILEILSTEVEFALNQEETKNRDGMDMALCTIDLEHKTLEFAGAKNPLIMVKDGVAQRIKGDRKNIGHNLYKEKAFEKHQIEINEPTSFYMFSDGYIDQFGGEKGRKFMTKRLQALLEEIHHKPMSEQHEILQSTLNEWMKNENQMDDILIVGFKIH